MEEKKVFMNEKNIATFVCPKCQKIKTADVSEYKDIDRAVRVKCRCSCRHSYSVLLERRKYYRKMTDLPGVYLFEGEYRTPMTVKDLSRNGLKFELKGKRHLMVGDTLFVEFPLDDGKKTFIRKEIVIKMVTGRLIGAEFCDIMPGNPVDKAIGFYLIPGREKK